MKNPIKNRDIALAEHLKRNGAGAGPHHTRELDVAKGSSRKRKHKKQEQCDT